MARRIFLERLGVTDAQVGTITGFRLQVNAHDAEDMPNEIFVYRIGVVEPNTEEQKATFENVATPADLEELPANGPTDNSPLLFRLATMDVLFRSNETLNETFDLIVADVTQLVKSLDRLDDLEVLEDILIGAPLEEEESSISVSISSSPG